MPQSDDDKKTSGSLRANTATAIDRYLTNLDGQLTTDLYALVLAEVEPPLLEAVMEYNRNNQSKAAAMLGINRATLRKKLKQYNLFY